MTHIPEISDTNFSLDLVMAHNPNHT